MTVASPQSSRCGPSSQRSPGRLTGSSGVSGMSSSPSRGVVLASPSTGEQLVELGVGEADERQVEVVGRQLLQLAGEQRLVPGAELGQLVVGQTVGLPLLLGQVVEHDHRRLGQPELRGRQDAAVPGDHLAVARHQHRHRPAELRHRAGDLRDLVRPVRLGVPRIGLQALERPRARCAPERSSGSCPIILSGGGVDSGGGFRAGFHWAAVDSFRVQAEATPGREQGFVLLADIRRAGGFRSRVASQKIAAVASELARLALPHTFPARRDPYNQWVSGRCSRSASYGWWATASANRSPTCHRRLRFIRRRSHILRA